MLCDLLRKGIQDGEFRPVNPLLTVRSMFNLLTSTIFTSRPTGTPDEMMQDLVDILFKGIEA